MKKLFFVLLAIAPLCSWAQNRKISEMNAAGSVSPAMYVPVVDPNEASPANQNKRLSISLLDGRYATKSSLTPNTLLFWNGSNLVSIPDGTAGQALVTNGSGGYVFGSMPSSIANLEDNGVNVRNSAAGTGTFTWDNVQIDQAIINTNSNTNLTFRRNGSTKLVLATDILVYSNLRGDVVGRTLGIAAIPFASMFLGTTASSGRLTGTFSANRTITIPDKDGTVAFLDDIPPGGSGDVLGAASSTDDAIVRFDGVTGKVIQNSGISISDANVITGAAGLTSSGSITFSGLTASRLVATGAGGLLTNTITSANLAASVSDETGTGALVFGTSPVFTTNISTPSIVSTGAISVTPASGSNLNVTLASTGKLVVNSTDLVVDTSNDRVGIQTATPASTLHVRENTASTGSTAGMTIENQGSGDAVVHFKRSSISNGEYATGVTGAVFAVTPGISLNSSMGFSVVNSGNIRSYSSITSAGTLTNHFQVNANSMPILSLYNAGDASNRYGLKIQCGQNSGSGTLIQFHDGDGTTVGQVTFSGTTTTYGTSSDYRMKYDIKESDLEYEWLKTIVKDYKWKEDGTEASGVIAQELYKHFPMAVHAPDSGMWSVDYGKLTIPLIRGWRAH